jgi:hypothetical protein
MTTPSTKAASVERVLQGVFGRTDAIEADTCVPAPFGCGGAADSFRNDISRKEYRISGLCQTCQDEVFTPWEE